MRIRTRVPGELCTNCFGPHGENVCPEPAGRPDEADPWIELEWDEHVEAKRMVDAHPDGMTLEHIGEAMGITRERVRQIEGGALRKLQEQEGADVIHARGVTGMHFLAVLYCERCGSPFLRRGSARRCAPCDGVEQTHPFSASA